MRYDYSRDPISVGTSLANRLVSGGVSQNPRGCCYFLLCVGCGCVGFPDGWVSMRSFRTVLLVTAIAFAGACASEEMTDTDTTDPEPISETTDVSAPTSTVPEPAAAPLNDYTGSPC